MYAPNLYVASPGQTQFDLTFSYRDRASVQVLVDGVEAPFTWVNATRVALVTACSGGEAVKVLRRTATSSPEVAFENVSVLLKEDLNAGQRQNLDRIQEIEIDLARTLRTPDGVPGVVLTPEANHVVAWNSEGDGLVSLATTDLIAVAGYADARVEVYTGDGVETDYEIDFNPGVLANLDVSIGGVTQTAGEDFTWAGTTVSFATPPPSGQKIQIRYARPIAPVPNFDAAVEAAQEIEAAFPLVAGAAQKASNLSDLASAASARTNLGFGYQAPPLYASNFPSLASAIAIWALLGGTLDIDTSFSIPTPISANLAADKFYRLTNHQPQTLTYTGANTDSAVIRLIGSASGRHPFIADAHLDIDGQDKARMGFWLDFSNVTGTNRRDARVHNMTVRNIKLRTYISGGSSGFRINGGFDFLWMRNVKAKTISRLAATGNAGSWGCIGIAINGGGTTAQPRRVVLEDFEVDTVTAEDTPGTGAWGDMDGVLVFVGVGGADAITPPIIRRGIIRESAGRAIKLYSPIAPQTVVQDITIYRSVEGVPQGSDDIDVQHGSGVVERITFHYSGNAHNTPTVPIDMGLGSVINGGLTAIRDIRMFDTTSATKGSLLSLYYNNTDTVPRRAVIENVKDDGKCETLLKLGALGYVNSGPVSVDVNSVDAEITVAGTKTDDNLAKLTVSARNLNNRGSSVPAVKSLAGAMRTTNWGFWRGDASISGFARYTGVGTSNTGFTNGFSGPGGGVEGVPAPGTSEISGRIVFPVREIAAGADYEFPSTGLRSATGGHYSCRVEVVSPFTGFGLYETLPGSTNWVSIKAAPSGTAYGFASGQGLTFVNGGSSTGAGSDIEVVKPTTQAGPKIYNRTAGAIRVQVTLNP